MMTTHPERDDLLALVDTELAEYRAIEIGRHVARCATCHDIVAELRASAGAFATVLQALDSTEPEHWASDNDGVASDVTPASMEPGVHPSDDVLPLRPRSRPGVQSPAAEHSRTDPRSRTAKPATRGTHALRWAAGILLITGAAASAAIIANRVLSEGGSRTLPTTEPTAADPRVAAVMVAAAGGAIRIDITGAGADSRLIVVFEERADARVAVEGAGAPRFTAARAGRVDLDLAGASAVVRLTLPRTLRDVNVTADGRTVATVQNGSVVPAEVVDGGVPIAMKRTE